MTTNRIARYGAIVALVVGATGCIVAPDRPYDDRRHDREAAEQRRERDAAIARDRERERAEHRDERRCDDRVFKALGDSSRRFLLDLLFTRDGQTLSELESELAMTRFGVMKHLRVLEEAGLVVTRRSGREKLHFLNAVPIRLIHDRWIDKYTERQVSALADLKTSLESKKCLPSKKRA